MVPQRLALDFVAPAAPPTFGRFLLILGVLALIGCVTELAIAWQAYHQEKTELADLAQRAATPEGTRRTPVNNAGMQIAGTVARDLTAPWSELLRSIESIPAKDVALQIVEPVVAHQSLRITADARHFDAMLDYIEQLRSRSLSNVVLTSHQIQLQQPGNPIRFQVQAKWGGVATPPSGAPVRTPDTRPSAQQERSGSASETARQPAKAALARGPQ